LLMFSWPDLEAALSEALTPEACSGTVAHWERTFARYQDLLARN